MERWVSVGDKDYWHMETTWQSELILTASCALVAPSLPQHTGLAVTCSGLGTVPLTPAL